MLSSARAAGPNDDTQSNGSTSISYGIDAITASVTLIMPLLDQGTSAAAEQLVLQLNETMDSLSVRRNNPYVLPDPFKQARLLLLGV